MTKTIYPDNSYAVFGYNILNQMTSAIKYNSSNVQINAVRYEYDGLGRLTRVGHQDAVNTTEYVQRYEYDTNKNLAYITHLFKT